MTRDRGWATGASVSAWFGRLLVLGASFAAAGCAGLGPPRSGEKTFRNLHFGSPQGHALRMDLYVPQSARPAPVAIWIFGGSWRFGSKAYHVNLRELTRHGIAVAAIQYRFSSKAHYPAQLEDCQLALNWLRAHGRSHGIDPRRIAASGESAGGHLAALLGAVEGKQRVRAVVALYPPTDLVSLGRQYAGPRRPSKIELLLGGPIEQNLALAAEASPIHRVRPDSPPFFLIHGALDELVPLEQSRKLQRRLRSAGVESRLVVVPGKGHWFPLDDNLVAEVAGFLHAQFAIAE